LSFREWFPAISQSQFSIQDASLKKLRTYSAIPYLLSMTTTCWHITHSLSPGRNPSQQCICGSLAPTEATYLIFDDFCMCYILFCTWGRRSWSAEPEIREVQRRQLEPHHIPRLLIDLMPMPHEHTRRSPLTTNLYESEYRSIPLGTAHHPLPWINRGNQPISATLLATRAFVGTQLLTYVAVLKASTQGDFGRPKLWKAHSIGEYPNHSFSYTTKRRVVRSRGVQFDVVTLTGVVHLAHQHCSSWSPGTSIILCWHTVHGTSYVNVDLFTCLSRYTDFFATQRMHQDWESSLVSQ